MAHDQAESRRPGRPRGSTTAQILTIAREAFVTSGFAGTRMDMIATRAGISKASLYRVSASKDDLYRAVVRDWVNRGTDAMRPHLAELLASADLRDALLRFVEVLQASILDPGVLAMRSLIINEASRHPDIAAHYVRNSWDRNTAALAAALAELHDRGDLRIVDPQIAAQQLTWLTIGPALNQHELTAGTLPPDEDQLRHGATTAVHIFLLAHGT